MVDSIITDDATWRLNIFIATLLIMLAWEHFRPARAAHVSVAIRRVNNLLLVTISTLLIRLTVLVLAIGVAAQAGNRGWGLFNMFDAPAFVAIPVVVLALELAVYWQHRVFHWVPWLWRLHRVHHSDLDFDTTTGLRFHPVEMIISMLFKMFIVLLLGASATSVVIFEVLLNASSLFNHGNVRLPVALERPVRWLLVTPDMHRVHHSALPVETNSNFGFLLSCWDRMFGTYRAQPGEGHTGMTVGLMEFRDRRAVDILALLLQPLWNSETLDVAQPAKQSKNEGQ